MSMQYVYHVCHVLIGCTEAYLEKRSIQMTERIGVCSWSLKPEDPAELIAQLTGLGLTRVQLAMSPMVQAPETWGGVIGELRSAGIEVVSGMLSPIGEDYATLETIRATGGVVPDGTWDENLAIAQGVAAIAQREGVDVVTFHAGFVPHNQNDPSYVTLGDRLTVLAELFADAGCELLLETGQETADDLLAFLANVNHPNIGVNFDPANMILYGKGDPIDAIRKLVDMTGQVHIKDAVATTTPGEWGSEVPAGTGQVDWTRFFAVLDEAGYDGDLVIEREAGDDRTGDIAIARDLVKAHLSGRSANVT
tara:strand:- start:57 stop:980 length:924 start_codon:yes stop_codon:yes gene_type:complete